MPKETKASPRPQINVNSTSHSESEEMEESDLSDYDNDPDYMADGHEVTDSDSCNDDDSEEW